jgi:hypothetical protein
MRGQIDAGPGSGFHLACHCDSCVRAQRHFGVPATRAEGVGLWQTTPDRITLETGAEHLRLGQLSPRGSWRWFAGCCGSQIGVTARTMRLPFVSLCDSLLADPAALGPVRAHSFVPQAGGGERTTGLARMVTGLFGRAGGALLSGRWRRTPFFDVGTGQPVAAPELLPRDAGRA